MNSNIRTLKETSKTRIRVSTLEDCLLILSIFVVSAQDCLAILFPIFPYYALRLLLFAILLYFSIIFKSMGNQRAIVSSSSSESFGVSAVEAEASGVPLIITDVPGLMESTCPGKSSIVVPRRDSDAIGKAIIEFYDNEEKRKTFGVNGRNYASENFEINYCFKHIEQLLLKYCK